MCTLLRETPMVIKNVLIRLQWWVIMAVTFATAYGEKRPNIVFLMIDDVGWNDVSYHGSDQVQTPNIDALAYRGVILKQYYSEAICTPARSALLTGKYPMRFGMHGPPLFNSEDRGIPLTERLLPSYLKELGYSTHLVGKWHVGMSRPEYLPTARGFDTHYGMRGGFSDYYTYNYVESLPSGKSLFGLDLFDNNLPQKQEDRYIVDALTDRAITIIQKHNGSQPLFLQVCHNAPHGGYSGSNLQSPHFSAEKTGHIAHPDRRRFAEVIANIDNSVANIVKALSRKGILDDTIIVFVSDNGAPTSNFLPNFGLNHPLRGLKFSPWDGGVRVPAFIWHSSVKPRVWNGLMHISDWLPTLTAAAGGKFKLSIDGHNLWDLINNNGQSKRTEVLVSALESPTNLYAAYRDGDYKIVIGNVTGSYNAYYGTDFLLNRADPPPYYQTLRSCEVDKIFAKMGKHLDFYNVLSTREATLLKQEDPVRDPTPCIPTLTRGCLYNVRRDPAESHDLWQEKKAIAARMTARLSKLWSMQKRRGVTNLQAGADPANFGYVWTPWVLNGTVNSNVTYNNWPSWFLNGTISS